MLQQSSLCFSFVFFVFIHLTCYETMNSDLTHTCSVMKQSNINMHKITSSHPTFDFFEKIQWPRLSAYQNQRAKLKFEVTDSVVEFMNSKPGAI